MTVLRHLLFAIWYHVNKEKIFKIQENQEIFIVTHHSQNQPNQ